MVKAVVGADGVTVSETTTETATETATETSTETATEEVNNMEVQIDDEIDEDDGERYSSYLLSSVEDENINGIDENINDIDENINGIDENINGIDDSRQVTVMKTACSKDDVDCNNDFKTQSKDDNCSGAAANSTTSPPPDVIMHHNNHDIIKRKSSRRSRRKRRSSTTVAAVSDPNVQMTPAIVTVSEEESLVSSSSVPLAAQMIAATTTVIDTINKYRTNIIDFDDDFTAKLFGISTTNVGTTVIKTTSANDDSERQFTATTTPQSQQVGYGPIVAQYYLHCRFSLIIIRFFHLYNSRKRNHHH